MFSTFYPLSGFSVEPAVPQGGDGRFDPCEFVAIVLPGVARPERSAFSGRSTPGCSLSGLQPEEPGTDG